METARSDAVARAIEVMWQQHDQPLSLSELADKALFSRFYFSRVFRAATGTSPGRFLTAIRLYRSKSLLLETSLSVTDISYLVGYNSPGTFSTRFTYSVGMSPARYRISSRTGFQVTTRLRGHHSGGIDFTLARTGLEGSTRTYVGCFGTPFQQGELIAGTRVTESGAHRLDNVPDGHWMLRAVTVPTTPVDPRPWRRRPLLVSRPIEVTVKDGHANVGTIGMHQLRRTDLPVLLAIPELDSVEATCGQAQRSTGSD